jgi:hypothetical protein
MGPGSPNLARFKNIKFNFFATYQSKLDRFCMAKILG